MIKRIENKTQFEEEIDLSKFVINKDKLNQEVKDFFFGNIKKGYKLGIPALDNHFVYKENEFYVLTGKKGSGKTTITQALQLMGSIKNDLIWVVCFKENADWSMKINYLGYLLGEYPLNVKKENIELYNKASNWIDDHFIFIDVDDIKTGLEVTKKLIQDKNNIHAVLLDPINSFMNGYADSGNKYADGVTTAIEILNFTKKWCSVHISQHPTMFNQRKKEAITSYDAEGGWFLNKASYTYVIDRERGTNENKLIIENVRNKLTGGKETDIDNAIILEWSPNKINIYYENGTYREDDVIGRLVREFNPLGIEIKNIPEIKVEDAFDDPPF